MALVKFITGNAAQFNSLQQKDENTLYFIEDEHRIYKGDKVFSGGIYKTIDSLPEEGEVNTLYVNSTDGSVNYWNGTSYQVVVPAIEKNISGTGSDNNLATTKAIVDYISEKLENVDLGDISERVSTLEGEMDTAQGDIDAVEAKVGALEPKVTTIEGQISTINGEGDGSIKKALSDAKSYADSLSSNYAPKVHTHTLSDITDAGSLAGKSQVSKTDLDASLSAEIDGKAEKSTTLAGYGIGDAYTKNETDSAIASAVAAAPHLKRSVVTELPDAGSADQNTIYMVGSGEGSEDSNYKEYMVINGKFELIGDSKVDLTDYAEKSYVDQAKSEAISTAAADAQSKATTAETNAKSYTDTKLSELDSADVAVEHQYVSAVSQNDGVVSVTRETLPVYSVSEGNVNGAISVNGSNVQVHGLGTAAYTSSDAYDTAGSADTALEEAKEYADGLGVNYATAEQGAKADTAVQSVTTGSTNGTIAVDGEDVPVEGLKSAAFAETSAFDKSGAANEALASAKAYVEQLLTWGTL